MSDQLAARLAFLIITLALAFIAGAVSAMAVWVWRWIVSAWSALLNGAADEL